VTPFVARDFYPHQQNAQLQFAGVENRFELLFNANKYIIKRETIKQVIEKANFLFQRSKDFKDLFKDLFELGLPFFGMKKEMCYQIWPI